MSKQIDLQKIMKTAVKKALKEDIEPAVKEVYKKHAETLKDIKPGKNAEGVTNAAAKKAQKKTAKHIARRMSDEKYIVSSDKYLAPEFKDTGAFSVYNDKPLETLMVTFLSTLLLQIIETKKEWMKSNGQRIVKIVVLKKKLLSIGLCTI